jgi:hypothetical protein
MSADAIVARVNAVPQGEQVTRRILFRTTDKRGRSRERETVSFRRYFGDERRLALFFTAPANIRDTAVLTWDYANTTEDDQWLYLPALRKVRRIPAADRGDYFLGTDFSFEDMKLDGQLIRRRLRLRAAPRCARRPLPPACRTEVRGDRQGTRYARTEALVDGSNWIVVRAEFWDTDDEHLKTLHAEDIREVGGIWTRHRLRMENHQSGHVTELEFSDVDYATPIDDDVFTQRALKRGL